MKKNNIKKQKEKNKNRDRGTIFVRVMAGILALLMLIATSATFIFAMING